HCGPTGSGKTTSLYTAINHLNDNSRNIQTVEDPVEGDIPGVNQAQVNPEIGLTFANVLRSYLRQDCDVILVGEIRDSETASLAVQAALTGHLILGTIHSNMAVGTIARLTELSVSPFFVASALNGVVSQRLVRRLCIDCRQAYAPPERVRRRFRIPEGQPIYRAVGCASCAGSGYRGRICVQEVMAITDEVQSAIHNGLPETELQRLAIKEGMTPILKDGLTKALAGLTTVEEVTLILQGVGLTADQVVEAEMNRIRRVAASRRGESTPQPASTGAQPVVRRAEGSHPSGHEDGSHQRSGPYTSPNLKTYDVE
ncbi:MAG: type II/IV secretion system protein, partial [Myxococcales bacterium]|nr:type II/IV secretion system protein [Myxococcales bacterium]